MGIRHFVVAVVVVSVVVVVVVVAKAQKNLCCGFCWTNQCFATKDLGPMKYFTA